MTITKVSQLPDDVDAWVVGVPEEALDQVPPVEGWTSARDQEFSGEDGQVLVLYPQRPRRFVVVGLGKSSEVTAARIRRAAAIGVRHAVRNSIHSVAVQMMTLPDQPEPVVEGIGDGLYRFAVYQHSAPFPQSPDIYVTTSAALPPILEALVDATNVARDWVNLAPRDKVPGQLADRMVEAMGGLPVAVERFDVDRLKAMGAGGLVGVGSGSSHPPVMLVLRYNGLPDNRETVALVGKGITFDSGGLSLKSKDSIKGMKTDMAGAAVVVSVVKALATVSAPVNVWAIACLAENLPSGTAQHPDDVITILDGTTVEIISTDAEGRLVLADGVAWAREQGVTTIIDVATLTGSSHRAFGGVRASYVTNSEDLGLRLEQASVTSGERVWRMPSDDEYVTALRSAIADVKNLGGGNGGMQAAALFVRRFAGTTPWLHLDIAGTEMIREMHGGQPVGATGFGVSLLGHMLGKSAEI